jgi:hypothetical protein
MEGPVLSAVDSPFEVWSRSYVFCRMREYSIR